MRNEPLIVETDTQSHAHNTQHTNNPTTSTRQQTYWSHVVPRFVCLGELLAHKTTRLEREREKERERERALSVSL